MPGALLGVDGGGTKTAAVLCTTEGEVLASWIAPPSNYQAIGVRAAQAVLGSIVAAAQSELRAQRGGAERTLVGVGWGPRWLGPPGRLRPDPGLCGGDSTARRGL